MYNDYFCIDNQKINLAENMRRLEDLEIIKKILRDVAPLAEVILYGSEARGDAREDSDFDLLILLEEDHISYETRTIIEAPLYRLSWQNGIEVNPLIMSKAEWESHPVTPFYCNVMNEGVRI